MQCMLHVTCYMSHILHVTKYQVTNMSHVTHVTCDMSHVTHVTCHKIQDTKILPNTQCVIYFWKAHAKYSSMVMVKTLHVTYVTCHMSHMLHVTNIN